MTRGVKNTTFLDDAAGNDNFIFMHENIFLQWLNFTMSVCPTGLVTIKPQVVAPVHHIVNSCHMSVYVYMPCNVGKTALEI